MDIGGNGADHQAQIALARLQSLFRLFAIIDVRGKCIPVENSSLDVAHRNHADLKPAVYAIEPTEVMLDIKWLAFRDRVAKGFDTVGKIVRVNHVVRLPLLCLLRRAAEILQKWSIEDLGCAIRRKAGKKARHVVQERARVEFSRTQGLLCSLAIIDVCKEEIPRGYLVFRISHWEATNLEPSVNAISTAATMLNLVDLSRFDRLFAHLNYARKVIRMNGIDQCPILQLFTGFAKILQGLPVQKLNLAHRSRRGHEPGNVVDDLPPGQFPRTQGLLSPLAILDVYTGSVPFKDVAPFILQWIAANQEPAIGTVKTANSRFRVDRGARSQTRLPLLDKFRTVVRVNRFRPPPALCFFHGHACVIEPHPIEEVAVAVRTSSPCRRGDRIDDSGKVALTRPQSLLCSFALLDVCLVPYHLTTPIPRDSIPRREFTRPA